MHPSHFTPPTHTPIPLPPSAPNTPPAGLILPTLALALLFLPVIAIFLPVFIGAGKARDDESSSRAYMCNLYQQPEPLKDARLIRDSVCEDLLFDPKNGSLARSCNDAGTKAASLEAAYFDALNRNCTLVGGSVYVDSSWALQGTSLASTL